MSENDLPEEQVYANHLQLAKIYHFFQKLPQMTVALVQGSAMGAALGLIGACDMVIASKGAFFQVNDTKLGLAAVTAIPYIMRRFTKLADAQQLLLASVSLSAENACKQGLVDKVAENEEGLKAELMAFCSKMTLCAPGAVAATKAVVLNLQGQAPHSFALNYIAEEMGRARRSAEAKGGLSAIQSKKRPAWAEKPLALP
eukprot:NODE_5045_length_1815_cov_10.297986.p3 GENE.NODE_5045_length_1815_cov_10.297986~~NODE_5045_length_1815_cov_10.297986.p3  ORF type:complete len:200 (+),score=83.90 NODE_5045_length_1815_cov_10.297986:240-839(+)